jgi:hypothetical protein
MPSTRNDSSGTAPPASPRFVGAVSRPSAADIFVPGGATLAGTTVLTTDRPVPVCPLEKSTMSKPDPAPWLTDYIARRLRDAGIVDDGTTVTVARDMSSDIAAAFTTLARLDSAGVVLES